jgi:hypothetical protein
MPWRRQLSVLFAAILVLLFAPVPAGAATSSQSVAFYNAGDHDPAYGPNSFVITDPSCDRLVYLISYSWEGGSGTVHGRCGTQVVVSIAPLGQNAHELSWRTCSTLLSQTWITQCRPYITDFVHTG